MPFEVKHHLSNIDAITRRADCVLCGDDSFIELRSGKLRCAAQRKYSPGGKGKLKLTYKEVDALKKATPNCELCGKEFDLSINTHIDHDHDTMEFRGILCRKCNNGLGFFYDNPDALIAAADYLAQRGKKVTKWEYTAKIGQDTKAHNQQLME